MERRKIYFFIFLFLGPLIWIVLPGGVVVVFVEFHVTILFETNINKCKSLIRNELTYSTIIFCKKKIRQ